MMKESKKKTRDKKELSFEENLEELESLVERLEHEQLTLDESLEAFERGIKLASLCSQKLTKADRKIEQLIEESGELRTEPFVQRV
ncbi:MAG: exodeoxyribonuclease VII small subunit [Methanosarcinaceae archaeon]|nr:exodeoxyribonuclease VII small subunit [Methanosarcinaceae archaeon]